MAYNLEQMRYIQDSYFSSAGILAVAIEQLRGRVEPIPSPSMIKSVWIESRYVNGNEERAQRKTGKKALNIQELDLIIGRMRMYGSLNAAARARGHNEESVKRRLAELNVLKEVIGLEARIKSP